MKKLTFLFLVCLTVGCKREVIDGEFPDFSNLRPVVTERGTSLGAARTAQIGPAGGELRSEDGRLAVSVPAGALSSTVTVGVEPISNRAPLGLGRGYRLTPEGVNFAKPVKLTFSYDNAMLTGSAAEFLWITSQKPDGTWEGHLNSELDAATRTVSTETSHFSDWVIGKMIDLALTPSSARVKTGQYVDVMVTGFLTYEDYEDELVPLTPVNQGSIGDNDLVPLSDIGHIMQKLDKFERLDFKEWRLDGVKGPVSNSKGKLDVYGIEATYTAPGKKPSPDNVAVTVTIEAWQKDGRKPSISITTPITITDKEFYAKAFIDGKTLDYYSPIELEENNAPDGEGTASLMYVGDKMTLVLDQILGNSSDHRFEINFTPRSGSTFDFACLPASAGDGIHFYWYEKVSSGAQKYPYEARNLDLKRIDGVCSAENNICTSTTITLKDYKLENEATVTGSMSGTLYYNDALGCNTTSIRFSVEFSLPLIKPL